MSRNHILNRSIFSPREKGRQEIGEQLIIRVGKGCNFRCVFCNVAENENVLSIKSSIKEILAITFYKIKYSNFQSQHVNVTISGGEPSIFPKETLFILKYFTRYFRDRGIQPNFDLQSNASNIDKDFAIQLAANGIKQALISSHAHDPGIFKQIIGLPYETMGPKFELGVQSLIDAGIFVTFNIVLNKVTIHHYLEHLKYLVGKYPTVQLYNIGYVQPHGMAQENFHVLVAQYKDITRVYNEAIGYLKSHGKTVHSHFVGPPLCYMDDWSTSMEYIHNKSLILGGTKDQTLIHSINDTNKTHPSACDRCMAKRVCSGVWVEYADNQELQTKEYEVRYAIGKIDTLDIVSIKKEYTGGKRQFFLSLGDLEREDVLAIFNSWGYLWISVVIFGKQKIPLLHKFASTNMQVHIASNEMPKWIEAISAYNKSVAFQFQIQLDLILIDESIDDAIIRNTLSTLGSNIHLHVPKKFSPNKLQSPYLHYFFR